MPQTITPPPGGGGTGTVTSIATGCGLAGGPITATGTISGIGPCWAAGGGTAQAQTATYSPAATLTDGFEVCWKPIAANSGAAPTFSPNGLAAHTIVRQAGAALLANDIITTAQACAIYNTTGTQWELQNPQTAGSVSSVAFTFNFCMGAAGCTASTSLNYASVDLPNGLTLDYCGANLAVAGTGSPVVVDIQDSTNTSIFGVTKISIGTGVITTVYQPTFSSSPYVAAKGAKFRIQVTSGDSNNVAQFGYASCVGH